MRKYSKKLAMSTVVAVCVTAAQAELVYTLDHGNWNSRDVNWIGVDESRPNDWDVSSNWQDGKVSRDGQWGNVFFQLSTPTTINLGMPILVDNAAKASGAFALVINKGSAQLTVEQSAESGSVDTLTFYAPGQNNEARTSFVNLSDHHAVFNIKVKQTGYRDFNSGIHPGAEFNRSFVYDALNPVFVFFAGDSAAASDYANTTIFRSSMTSTKPVTIEAKHIVKLEGAAAVMTVGGNDVTVAGRLEADGGSVSCKSLSTTGGGEIRLHTATVTVTEGLAGAIRVAGLVTINHGAAAIDISGMTFAEGALLELTGTGTVTKDPLKTYPEIGEFVKMNVKGDNSSVNRMNNKAIWGDGEADISAEVDYLVDARSGTTTLRAQGSGESITFAGKSLTVVGGPGNIAKFYGYHGMTVSDIRFLSYSCLHHADWGGAVEFSTPAKVTIEGSECPNSDGAVVFTSEGNRTVELNGVLSGNGALRLRPVNDSQTNPIYFNLYGDNSNFKGCISADTWPVYIRVNSQNGLGGDPSTVLEKGLVIANGSTVEFTSAIYTWMFNRGLYIDGDGTVKNSAEVVWFGPLSFSDGGTLTKEGDGELVVLGPCSAGRVLLKGLGRAIKFKTAYADIVEVESGLPGYRVVVATEEDYRAYRLEKIRGLSILVY
jgi:hypothetical protein